MLNKLKNKKRKAFTLIEVTVSLAIVSMMMIISLNIAISLVKNGMKTQARAEVNRNINYALELVKRNAIQSNTSTIYGVTTGTSPRVAMQFPSRTVCFQWNSASNTFYQYDNYDNVNNVCSGNSQDVIGSATKITYANFTYADSFLEITFKGCDAKQIVYNCSDLYQQYYVVTGALVRN